MENIKIHILYKFHKGAFGGANQFLTALKKELIRKGFYTKDIFKADSILFHPFSYENFKVALKYKMRFPNKNFILRIDGPLYMYRGNSKKLDLKIYELNTLIADGIVFQSNWSRKCNYFCGFTKSSFEATIMNASNNSIFYPKKENKIIDFNKEKCRIIATSWSPNINKGFELYQYLDNNLDFNKYSMKFIGNSPIKFKNISHIKPLPSNELANSIRESDIFITGSKKDPCSNSLIEALSCGLPCVGLNDGGHPEIIKQGGELFNTYEECLKKIELVKNNYIKYKNSITVFNMNDISDQYIKFIKKVHNYSLSDKCKVKKIRLFDYYKFLYRDKLFHPSLIKNLINEMLERLYNYLKTLLLIILR